MWDVKRRGPNEAMVMNAWLITATSSSLPIAPAAEREVNSRGGATE